MFSVCRKIVADLWRLCGDFVACCGKLWQVVACCGKLWQVVASLSQIMCREKSLALSHVSFRQLSVFLCVYFPAVLNRKNLPMTSERFYVISLIFKIAIELTVRNCVSDDGTEKK